VPAVVERSTKDKKRRNEGARPGSSSSEIGKNYYSEYLNGPALKRMIGNVEAKKVLDMGCGERRFSRFFAKAGAEVTGIDLSDAYIYSILRE
jgi:2-polyprenyl-3-methyl-5-hydroxy-6-metoxy-1,4-benzoquinol methylase